jgi:hypothetical protein
MLVCTYMYIEHVAHPYAAAAVSNIGLAPANLLMDCAFRNNKILLCILYESCETNEYLLGKLRENGLDDILR